MGARASTVAAAVALAACGRVGFDLTGDGAGGARSYPSVVLADNPRAYYRLGDPQGLMVRDEIVSNGDATIDIVLDGVAMMGMPGALPNDPDTATYFRGTGNSGNGSEAWAAFPDVWPTWSGDFTVEAFVTAVTPAPGAFNTSLLICEKYLVDGFRSGWEDTSAVTVWSSESGGPGGFTTTGRLATNAWTHLVLVHNGPTMEVYLDGQSQGAVGFTYTPPTPTVGGHCGFGSFNGLPSDMILDELSIYDRALPPTQIAAHFAASGR